MKHGVNTAEINTCLANTAVSSHEAERDRRGIPLTFLAVVGGPAAVVVAVVHQRLLTQRLILHDAQAHVVALLGLLIPTDHVIELRGHDERPVHRVQVAELGVLLDPHGAAGDVPQVVQADVLQVGHLEDHQRVVVEEVAAADDAEVGEERAEAVQAGDAEEQQVVGDDGQLGEAEGAKVVLVDVLGLVVDEEDPHVALHHRAVLQRLQVADVVTDVHAEVTD